MSDITLFILAIVLLIISATSFNSYMKQLRATRFPKSAR